ncbi:DNA polymerase III subunit alpha [bacterium]|nr:DNA polymerase III subunit alpha [bacterium]
MHLDAHSWYSFHDGVSAPEDLCAQAAELGFEAFGIADTDGCYGLLHFHRAALKCRIHPVLGISLTDPQELKAQAGRRSLEAGIADPTASAALVIARDRDGYGELCRLATLRQLDPEFNLARALLGNTAHCYIISDRPELLRIILPRLGPHRVFMRCSPDYGEQLRARQIRQLKLARELKLHPVACTDVHFLRPQDQPVHHVLRAIGQNSGMDTARGVRRNWHYLGAPTELGGYYYDCPQALENARKLAMATNVEFEYGKWLFPPYELPGGGDPARALHGLCRRSLDIKFGNPGEEYLARLEMELGAIDRLGYTSYFLAVYDIVRESRRRRIPCLGRGSAANSLVSWLLGLTPVDPIRYDMYFERFLNPARKSPPDIDIDFNWRRRDEIVQYVYDRWGHERVAMISTHVTFRARSALREVAKVYGLGDREISTISRFLPNIRASGLDSVVRDFPEMRGVDLHSEPYCHVLPLATRLAGRPRHLGIHCGGIVIAPGNVDYFTGLQRAAKGFVVTQYDMHPMEAVGLIKIDLLGNRSLGVLEDTLARLREQGVKPDLSDHEQVSQDPATNALVRHGETMGCFYIESPAMRQLLKRLVVRDFIGLTAASSVIRPGVAESGMMQEYIRRVNGARHELRTHPRMLELLPETHGVMIYQEDVIRVAHELAGLSRSDADLMRRVMSKPHRHDGMLALGEKFVSGCEARGMDTASALEIWRQLASFSGYSFCKAHSASFATLSYQVAWLKAHYPAQFMAAVLDNGGGFYGARAYISECERLGLSILPPDVNHSGMNYSAELEAWREPGEGGPEQSGQQEVRLQSDNRDQGPGTGDRDGGPEQSGQHILSTTEAQRTQCNSGNHKTRNPKPETSSDNSPLSTDDRRQAAAATATGNLQPESSSGPRSPVTGPSSSIRLPLVVIKGLPVAITERIVSARAHGPFRSLPDFIRRCGPSESELDLLILAGALDSLGMSRPELLWLAQQERKAGLRHSTPKKRRGGAAQAAQEGLSTTEAQRTQSNEQGAMSNERGGTVHPSSRIPDPSIGSRTSREGIDEGDPRVGMSDRPAAGVPATSNQQPVTSQLPFDESARIEEFRRRMAGRLDDYDELKLCALELKHYGMLVRRHPLSLYANLVSGLVDAREMPRYSGRWVRMLGWCIATKRVDLSRRRQVQDMIELQAANHDDPEQYTADEDELSVSGIGGDEDYELNDTAADLGLVRRGGQTDDWAVGRGGPEQSGQQGTEARREPGDGAAAQAAEHGARSAGEAGAAHPGNPALTTDGRRQDAAATDSSSAPHSSLHTPHSPSRNRGTDSHTMGGFIGPGNSMKFMSMEDLTGTFECTLRADKYARFAPLTRYTGPFLITGKVEEQFGTCTLSIQELKLLRLDELDRLVADDAEGGRRKGSKPASYAPQEAR